jgi:acetylornithine deacetylase
MDIKVLSKMIFNIQQSCLSTKNVLFLHMPNTSSLKTHSTSRTKKAVALLTDLIRTPSMSREEGFTADLIAAWLAQEGGIVERIGHNVIGRHPHHDPKRPSLLLVSHHDTVKPNPGYTRDPFEPTIEDGLLYGLGSNDAGGPLVSMLAAFVHFLQYPNAPYNLVVVAAAEEEISGLGGIESCLSALGPMAGALVGEPTRMQMAVAERGLLVVNCTAVGKSGHAARQEGVNALYEALPDLIWTRDYHFERVSPLLGPVTMQTTIIQAGSQHNVVPAECVFTIDIRINELYTHEEVLDILKTHMKSTIAARSTRLRASIIDEQHPLVKAGRTMGLTAFGSPTLSDKALLPYPALKIGPGDSARSHTADEYIALAEIQEGIDGYIALLEGVFRNA